jgi:hypothetical protein
LSIINGVVSIVASFGWSGGIDAGKNNRLKKKKKMILYKGV